MALKIKIFINNFIDFIGRGHRFKYKICFQKLLEENYSVGDHFYIVQVGANDGKSFDFLFSFIKERDSKGVLVEPIKEYFKLLENNYKYNRNIKLVNKAVHPFLNEVELFKVNELLRDNLPDWAQGIASLDREHHKKSCIPTESIITERVEADTLMNILKENYIHTRVDLLQIDVEGFDYEVLKMYSFDWMKPKFIKMEICNLSFFEKSNTFKLLSQIGYRYYVDTNDLIAILKK